jgi:hypothetical protein
VVLACLPIAFTMEGFVAEVAGYVALFSPFDVFVFSMLILHRRPVPQALRRALTATLIFAAIGVVLILSIRWLSLHGAG